MKNSLENMTKFIYGNPCEMIKQYKNIDFAVIDCKFQDYLKIFKTINLNPIGSTMVVNNFHHRKDGISFAEVVEGKNCGVKSFTLPIGEGMHLTRIGSTGKRVINRRYKRFHVTYENWNMMTIFHCRKGEWKGYYVFCDVGIVYLCNERINKNMKKWRHGPSNLW